MLNSSSKESTNTKLKLPFLIENQLHIFDTCDSLIRNDTVSAGDVTGSRKET
jgi:hypothetical protein